MYLILYLYNKLNYHFQYFSMTTEKETKSSIFNRRNNRSYFLIRKCTYNDLEKVKDVNERELPEDYPYFFYKSILDNYPESFLIACPRENPREIVGYIMWRVERTPSSNSLRLVNNGHLVSIAVSEEYRRQGIATALLKKSMAEVRLKNVTKYVLEVRVSNYNAINLYEAFNFDTANIKKKYYRDGENAYYMVKKVINNN